MHATTSTPPSPLDTAPSATAPPGLSDTRVHGSLPPPLAPPLEDRKQASLAAIVRLREQGLGNYEVAEILNLVGMTTPAQGKPWSGQRVYKFLAEERPDDLRRPLSKDTSCVLPKEPSPSPSPSTLRSRSGAEHVAAQKATRRASGN